MKTKIVLTLLSLGCVASVQAATSITAEKGSLQEGLALYWNFDNGSTDYQTATGVNITVNTGIADGHKIATGGVNDSGYIHSQPEGVNKIDFYDTLSGANIAANSFTLSFKTYGLSADYRTLVSFNLGDTQYNMQTSNSSNGSQICLYGAGIHTEDNTSSVLKGTEWVNVVITSDGTTLTMYVNDMKAEDSLTLSEGATFKNFQIASLWGDGTRASDAKFDDVALWNRTLNSEEISYLTSGGYAGGNVPEPTTATLSLLALAGLAARRRRK